MFNQKETILAVLFITYYLVGAITSYRIVSTSDVNRKHDINYYDYNSDDKGNYNFSFKTPDIEREERGQVINFGQPNQYMLVTGKYTYAEQTQTEGDAKLRTVYYTADKDGYTVDENRAENNDTPTLLFRDFDNLNYLRTLVGG